MSRPGGVLYLDQYTPKTLACSVEGCSKPASIKHGFCKKHLPKKQCAELGCESTAFARGVCVKHGELVTCNFKGCTTNTLKSRGHCTKHAVCAATSCTTRAIVGKGFCYKHGAYGQCTTSGCSSNARGSKGVCTRHDLKMMSMICSASGCRNKGGNYKAGGLCSKHSGVASPPPTGFTVRESGGISARQSGSLNGYTYGAHALHAVRTLGNSVGNANAKCIVPGCLCFPTSSKGICLCSAHENATCWIAGCTHTMELFRKTCMKHSSLVYCGDESGCSGFAIKAGGGCIKHIFV